MGGELVPIYKYQTTIQYGETFEIKFFIYSGEMISEENYREEFIKKVNKRFPPKLGWELMRIEEVETK